MTTWDERKRRENLRKHGMDFAEVERFDFDLADIELDRDADEERYRATGYIGDKICFLVFAFNPDGSLRIISLRPATSSERKRYANE